MKLKINPTVKHRTMQDTAVLEIDARTSSGKLSAALADLEAIFVDRSEEINVLKLAIATSHHVLFEGAHGIAKSDVTREAFRRIRGDGLSVYDKIFSKGTNADDVFGPVSMKQYKEHENWKHNTAGSLPTAHFANMEELGRASDFLLPTMMTVLNERIFHNGKLIEKCPLITAVGTANSISDSEDLAAFHDRFLFRVKVNALGTEQKIGNMIERSLTPRPAVTNTVSLNEVRAINLAVNKIMPDSDTIELYTSLVKTFQREAKIPYISDRRLVQTFKIARAQALFCESEFVTPSHLDVVRYGVMQTGNDTHEQLFNGVLSRVIGDSQELKAENEEFRKIEKYFEKVKYGFSPTASTKEITDVKESCRKLTDALRGRTKGIKSPSNSKKMNEIVSQADELMVDITNILAKRK